MALLRIGERAGLSDGANAELSFEHTETYPITLSDPFAEADEQRLEWYFEDWLSMPFTNTVEAQAIAASTVTYGETLFRQVFADRDAYARYKPLELNTLRIEIADYYQKALALFIEFNDRYHQAMPYQQLGSVAEKQRRWAQALDYYLKALPVWIEFNDEIYTDMILRSLARLWQASQDPNLPAAVGGCVEAAGGTGGRNAR